MRPATATPSGRPSSAATPPTRAPSAARIEERARNRLSLPIRSSARQARRHRRESESAVDTTASITRCGYRARPPPFTSSSIASSRTTPPPATSPSTQADLRHDSALQRRRDLRTACRQQACWAIARRSSSAVHHAVLGRSIVRATPHHRRDHRLRVLSSSTGGAVAALSRRPRPLPPRAHPLLFDGSRPASRRA